MKAIYFSILILGVLLASCGQGTPESQGTASADTSSTGKVTSYDTSKNTQNTSDSNKTVTAKSFSDADFLQKAYTTGVFEIQAGQLAVKNSQNAMVKQFAKMMVQEHTSMNKDVSALAKKLNITLETALTGDTQDEYNKLNGLTGADFDKEYTDANVKGHKEAIAMFQSVANGKNSADAKQLANAALPNLQNHLSHAETVQKQLTGGLSSIQ